MFDIFATILSAGVVISVVTLVVHEPLLLAAGISTILGVMFLLLPVFASMTPVMGYLLVFTGLVGLAYGVLSTRSWLNVLHARRLQALARRQQLQAARARDDDTAAPKAAAPQPARSRDDEDDLPPRLAARLDREETPLGAGTGSSALARVGRRLGRGEPEPEPKPEVKPAGKPWRNPYGPAASPLPAAAPSSPASPSPQPAPPAPAPQAALPPPPPPPVLQAPPVPAKPAKLLSRGAQRIKRIKEESRRSLPRHLKPKPAPAQAAAPPLPLAPPPPAPSTAAPPTPVADPDEAARRARRQRDLMELELLDVDPAAAGRHQAVEEDNEPRGSRPFLSRIARRT